MWDVGQERGKRQHEQLALAAALLALLLVACGRGEQVEVGASPAAALPRPAAMSTFQGEVTAIDSEGGVVVVAVGMVWAPVMDARPHERRVTADAATQWDPGPHGIAQLLVGDNVQVEAEGAQDGTWRARRVQLFDVD